MTDSAPKYIAVDWGTTSFRLWLLDGNDQVIAERRSGEGMTTAAKTGFPQVLNAHLEAVNAPADLPIIVCGMAGARQGWMEAGYVDVPASLPSVLNGAVKVSGESRDIRILPGIAQRSQNAPDVIRGEETQLIGALGSVLTGTQVVCMPGTHSKWVHVSGDTVSGFSTFMTGELFDVLSKHSVLSHSLNGAEAFDGGNATFIAAVQNAFKSPEMVTNSVFTVRSGMLLHGLSPTDAAARLSGTLIGAEIAGGLSSLQTIPTIRLVGSGKLGALYESAFRALSLAYETIDADEAVRRGLSAAAKHIFFS